MKTASDGVSGGTKTEEEFSVEDLAEALRSARVGVWDWDLVSNYLRWSDMTHDIYGVSRGEFGNTFDSVVPHIFPDDRQNLQRTIEHALATCSDDFTGDQRVVLADGTLRWVEGRGRVITDANGQPARMLGTVVDATARRQAEQRLRESDERLRLFTAHATDYVYDTGVGGALELPNIVAGSFERTTGTTPEAVAARGGWLRVVHPEDRDRCVALRAELVKGRSVLNEYRIVDDTGRTRWLRDRMVPVLDDSGRVSRVVGGVSDITEQRALEERLIEAQRMEALARLAGGVAHDFNNLLTVLAGELEFLRAPSATEEAQASSFAEIDATLTRATRLTSQLLAFGRTQPGPLRVIDVCETVRNAHSMLVRAAGERIRVQVTCSDVELRAAADANDIHLVLLNLTLNARDAMPDGGTLVVAIAQTEFSQESRERRPEMKPGCYVSIAIKDSGPGIPEEFWTQIFQPFFTTKGHRGTGLGLPTCFSIVERYGGVLYLKESSPAGSTFQIFLPVSDQAVAAPSPAAARDMVGGTEHVLVVEDDAAVRSVTQRGLRSGGYRVTAVGSAEEAMGLGSALGSIDALLTDVRLPGLSGLDLAAQLRHKLPGLSILVMSGHVEDPGQQAILSQGTYAFLPKPFSLPGLLRRLREVLDADRQAQWPHAESGG